MRGKWFFGTRFSNWEHFKCAWNNLGMWVHFVSCKCKYRANVSTEYCSVWIELCCNCQIHPGFQIFNPTTKAQMSLIIFILITCWSEENLEILGEIKYSIEIDFPCFCILKCGYWKIFNYTCDLHCDSVEPFPSYLANLPLGEMPPVTGCDKGAI